MAMANGNGGHATGEGRQNGGSGGGDNNNFAVKTGLAQMLKGGVIMDVVNAEQVGTYC